MRSPPMLVQEPASSFPEHFSDGPAHLLAMGTWRTSPVLGARIELQHHQLSVGRARRSVELHLQGRVEEALLQDVRLLVSEIVTNAVIHGPTEVIVVDIAISDSRVRVEVCDGGVGFEFSGGSRPVDTIGGQGLRILDALASHWGVAGDDGTCVWFELERSERQP